jgi:hypothetical protein
VSSAVLSRTTHPRLIPHHLIVGHGRENSARDAPDITCVKMLGEQ